MKKLIKEPKYKGPKKGYAAIFVGESIHSYNVGTGFERIRIIHSRPRPLWGERYKSKYCYDSANSDCDPSGLLGKFKTVSDMYIPCWVQRCKSEKEQVEAMYRYDRENFRKTIFLGYVRDVE